LSRHGVVAGLAVAALLLSGCASSPGAAAVVDGHAIPEQTVQDRTQSLVDENASDPSGRISDPDLLALLNRYQATDLVRHQLVLAAVQAEGITVTNEQVQKAIEQNGGVASIGPAILVPTDAVPDAIYDYLALGQLIDKMPAGGVPVTNVTVTVDVVIADGRDEAVAARAKYLKDPAAMDADAAALRASQQVPGGQVSLLQSPQNASVGIFSAPEGEIVLYPNGPDQFYVVRVTKRAEAPATLTKQAAQSVTDVQGRLVLASLLLAHYPAAKDVTVNPRFGDWDPNTLQVVAGNSGL
jgi:hypothetical protein